jgi:superfamily II DNA or RNA helicase
MSIVNALASQVTRNVQHRGRDYFERGAVDIHTTGPDLIEAEVWGTEDYLVSLRRLERGIGVSCSCPYYADRQTPCKHVWATLLAAEDHGHMASWNDGRPLALLADEEPRLDGDDDLDLDDDLGDRGHVLQFPDRAQRPHGWRQQLRDLEDDSEGLREPAVWPSTREILYIFDAEATLTGRGLILEIATRERRKDGQWGKSRARGISQAQIPTVPDPRDQQILMSLLGAPRDSFQYARFDFQTPSRFQLTPPMFATFVPLLCSTGRCLLRTSWEKTPIPLAWDAGAPWEFWLRVRADESGSRYLATGWLRRGEETMDLSAPATLVRGGLLLLPGSIARLEDSGAFDLIALLRKERQLSVPVAEAGALVEALLARRRLPRLDLPDELRFEQIAVLPRMRLKISPQVAPGDLDAALVFEYDGVPVAERDPAPAISDVERRRRIERDSAAEAEAAEKLKALGARRSEYVYDERRGWQIPRRRFAPLVRELLAEGWRVEADGKVFRRPGRVRLDVGSRRNTAGIDWFELRGGIEFGDQTASLPKLLEALDRGEQTVELGDGTFGMIPEEWLRRFGLLAAVGKTEDEALQFAANQAGFLDALLAEMPEVSWDTGYEVVRDRLRSFEGIAAAEAPAGFIGELRGYQREGLGWLHFLRGFDFGGCLADDMGLGKTIQVLALLESRREARAGAASGPDRLAPSLVVVPKSLVFNWKLEAARFTPRLRILDHTGSTRTRGSDHFDEHDVVLTTYGTLRRDALHFRKAEFDYVILDEAQAIKNAGTESAKAVRLIRGHHRLALSGTPVENHLGELWSLFEFLNPGMLGSSSIFRPGEAGLETADSGSRVLLARALRPFILRRTKEQVTPELPAKLEQTLYCELERTQRATYDELRDHYRRTLLQTVERDGLGRSKLHVLEALLRLRQAACHPGLIDPARVDEPSAKLDLLLPQLEEVLEEGHKALVFSQFTSMLAILRRRLDARSVVYEYLDGRTRDRAARVARFQESADCRLFLVSLKAGGLGLNLTAAEYVFLLDPWWNPAVEAQAIDRTHRIGQTRRVFAYRLIARDTVEEKVLELQRTKRALADAILGAESNLIRDLSRADLELLLT